MSIVEPDTLDEVMLKIEDERLVRRIDLIQEANKKYKSQQDETDNLKKLMRERIDPSTLVSSGGGGSSLKIEPRETENFTVDQFKYGLTTFMMNKISEVINSKFESINNTQKYQFVKIFETLKDLILENKDDPDYNNFVNDVLFIFYNCVLDLNEMTDVGKMSNRVDAAIQEAVLAFENFSNYIFKRDTEFPLLSSRSENSYDTSIISDPSESSNKSSLTIESIKSEAFQDFYTPEVGQNKNEKPFIFKQIKKIQVVEVNKNDDQSQSSQPSQSSKTLKIMLTSEGSSTESNVNPIVIPQDKLQTLVLADSVLNHVYSDTLLKTKEFRESNFTKAVHSGVAFSKIVSDIIPDDVTKKQNLFEKFGTLAFAQSEYQEQTDTTQEESIQPGQMQVKPVIPVLNLFDLNKYAQSLSQISDGPSQISDKPSQITDRPDTAVSNISDITMSSFDDFFIGQFNAFHKAGESSVSIDEYTSTTEESSEPETETDATSNEAQSAKSAATAVTKLEEDKSIIGLLHRTEDDFLTTVTQKYIDTNHIEGKDDEIKIDKNGKNIPGSFPARTHKFFIGYLKKNDKTKVWESHLREDDFDNYRHLTGAQPPDTQLKKNLRIIYKAKKDNNKIKLTGKELNFDATGCGRAGTSGQQEQACANAETDVYKIFLKTMDEYITNSKEKLKKEDIHSILYLLVVEKVYINLSKKKNTSNFCIIPFHEPNLI